MVKARVALIVAGLLAGIASAAAVALGAQHTTARPNGNATAFLRNVVMLIARNDYAVAWQTLHPAQQLVAPLAEYVSCESQSPIPGRLDWIKVLRVRNERIVVPGTSDLATTVAVTFRLRISDPTLGASVRVTHTVHAVPVDGRWRWMLPAHRYEMYRTDACGYTPPA